MVQGDTVPALGLICSSHAHEVPKGFLLRALEDLLPQVLFRPGDASEGSAPAVSGVSRQKCLKGRERFFRAIAASSMCGV